MSSIAKTVTLSGTNISGDTVELEIPVRSKKVTSSNNVTSFARPIQNPTPGKFRQTRALNMNRIDLNIQVQAKVSDEFADKNHNGSGDRPDLGNKEDWIDEVWKLYVAGTILTLDASNSDTSDLTSSFSGYLHNVDWQEKAGSESSVYDVTLKLIDEVQMTS